MDDLRTFGRTMFKDNATGIGADTADAPGLDLATAIGKGVKSLCHF